MKPINPNLLSCSRLTVLVVLAGWSADGVAVLRAQDAAKAAEAVEAAKKQADDDAEKSLPAGHSNHGEAFNEGPRQKAYLMEGTGDVSFPATCAKPIVQKFILEAREGELLDVIKRSQQEGMIDYTSSLVNLVEEEMIHHKVALESTPKPEELKMRLKGIS